MERNAGCYTRLERSAGRLNQPRLAFFGAFSAEAKRKSKAGIAGVWLGVEVMWFIRMAVGCQRISGYVKR